MGFVEDVRARIDETLVHKIQAAEEELERLNDARRQCVESAADSKLELLLMRHTSISPGEMERVSRESALEAHISDCRERYMQIEHDMDALNRDLNAFRGIMADLQNSELQLIA